MPFLFQQEGSNLSKYSGHIGFGGGSHQNMIFNTETGAFTNVKSNFGLRTMNKEYCENCEAAKPATEAKCPDGTPHKWVVFKEYISGADTSTRQLLDEFIKERVEG